MALRLTVADTGIGIAPEQQWQIFGAFVQADASTSRKFGGTGLGLTISAQLVELMGGRIWLTSDPGHGSTFHVALRLPLADPAGAATVERSSEALRGLGVLAVDDNPTARVVIGDLLASWGMAPMVVDSATAAMAALGVAADRGAPIPLALIDAEMPGVDGFGLTRLIVADPRLTALKAIMLLPAGAPPRPQRRLADKIITTQLTKPLRQSELLGALLAAVTTAPPAVAAPAKPATPAAPARAQRRLDVLVVEDNATNRAVVAHVLKQRGHTVTLAATGSEAVTLAAAGRYDVVLMDVQMPGMDGYEATAAIRSQTGGPNATTPIVAVTAHATSSDRERCLAAGMNAFVAKPVRPAALLAAIDDLLDGSARPAAARPPSRRRTRRPRPRAVSAELAALLPAFGNDRELLGETIAVFLVDAPQQLQTLRAAAASADPAAIARAAHAIKGAVSLFSLGAAYTVVARPRGRRPRRAPRPPGRTRRRRGAAPSPRSPPAWPACRQRSAPRDRGPLRECLRGLLHERDVGPHLLDEQVALDDGAGPVAGLGGFGDARQRHRGVGVARREEQVLEPRAAGDAGVVQPGAFELQQCAVHAIGGGGIEPARGQRAADARIQRPPGVGEGADRQRQRLRVEVAGAARDVGQRADEAAQRRGVGLDVERQDERVGEPQGHRAPELRHQVRVAESRIADPRHPVVAVVGRVVDAVGAVEAHVDDRHAEVVDEHGVVGAAADAGHDQRIG